MTFLTQARSIQSSAPIELYKFTRGTTIYRVSSAAYDVVHDPQTYYAGRVVIRGKIQQTEDIFKNVVTFSFPRSDSFASYYIAHAAVFVTYVEIIKVESDGSYIPFWKGRFAGVKVQGNKITADVESIFTSMKRPGLRKRYELMCNNSLYDSDCKVARASYQHFVTILDITGKEITVSSLAAFDNGYFTGGMVSDLNLQSYYISTQDGDVLTSYLTPEFEVGDAVSLFPGCSHLFAECVSKFNNGLNFGGFPFIPGKNPFEGSII